MLAFIIPWAKLLRQFKPSVSWDFSVRSVNVAVTINERQGFILEMITFRTTQPEQQITRTSPGFVSTYDKAVEFSNGCEHRVRYTPERTRLGQCTNTHSPLLGHTHKCQIYICKQQTTILECDKLQKGSIKLIQSKHKWLKIYCFQI